MVLALVTIGLILLLPVQAQTVSRETPPEPPVTFDGLVDKLAVKYGQNVALAKAVIKCESSSDHSRKGFNYNDGKLWSTDVGYWQLNDYYHQEAAKKLGFDIYDWKGNLEYGFLLMKNEGLKPWEASRHCWSKKAS